ncbi:MAG TPA: putative O-glycosylation ligase, exosortase A system-associated [Arenibaculum sp.]|nr:putative O-glycosylation ligase, exosortase A system-associated [Arenibaculum sp.]
MRDTFIMLIVMGMLPVALARPFVGVLIAAWLSMMSPHRLGWGFAYGFPFVYVTVLVTLVGIFLTRDRRTFPIATSSILLFLLIFWGCVTTVFALSYDLAYERLIFTLKILALPILALVVINTRERIHALVWVTVLSLGFYGVKGGIFTLMTGGSHRVWGPPGTFIADNNQLALALIMTLPLIRYLQLETRSRLVRLALTAMLGLSVVSILGSHSRGALVGLSVTALALAMLSRRKLLLSALIVVSFGGAFMMMPDSWHDRMSTLGESSENQDASVQGRFEIWALSARVALDRPLVGGGFDMLDAQVTYDRYGPEIVPRSAHSITFQVLGEHGFVGLFLFYALIAGTWLKGIDIRRKLRGRPDLLWASELATMVQISLIGYVTAGQFLNLAFFDLLFFVIAVMIATGALIGREAAQHKARQWSSEMLPGRLAEQRPA